MNIAESRNLRSIHFDSLVELLDYNIDIDPTPTTRNKFLYKMILESHKQVSDSNTKTWYGPSCHTVQDVIQNALCGGGEGYEIANKRAQQLEGKGITPYHQTVQKFKRKRIRNGYGDELDIHRVYQGQLDKAWSRTIREKIDSKHQLFTLMVDVGGNAYVDVVDSLWRAAVVLKITDQLIKMGKSVKIIVGSSCMNLTSEYNMIHTTDIVVKQYNEPLSLERLVAMSNIGFHRVFNFMARALIARDINSTFGASINGLAHTPPIQMADEVAKGHTRYVYIGRYTSKQHAESGLVSVYNTLKEYSEN